MKNHKNVLIKSRLRITKSAFTQFIQFMLGKFSGFEGRIQGYLVKILDTSLVESRFNSDEINQLFEAEIILEKEQGWLPFEVEAALQLQLAWRIIANNGFPGVKIVMGQANFKSSPQLEVLNMNVGIPKIVQKKVVSEIHEKIPLIEKIVNTKIKELIETVGSQVFQLSIKDLYTTINYCIRRGQWAVFSNSGLFDVHLKLTLWHSLERNEKPTFTYLMNRLTEPLSETEVSVFRLCIPYDKISSWLDNTKLSIGRFGTMTVQNSVVSQAKFERLKIIFQLHGETNISVFAQLEPLSGEKLKVDIGKLELDLDNKLLDFGASIFERHVRKKVQEQLNNLCDKGQRLIQTNVVSWISSELEGVLFPLLSQKPVIMKYSYRCMEKELIIVAKSELPSEIIINKVPTELLTKVGNE